jgi:hypothetical protein
MATKPLICIINNQQWPRAYLRAELIERGFEAVGFTDLAGAITALGHFPSAKPSAVVLELRDQAIETRLMDIIMKMGIPMILLEGLVEANEPVVKQYHWAAVMKRPTSIGAIADKVQEIVSE